MNAYFIAIDGSRQGPFSIDELKTKEITPDTLVWTEKMEHWTEAKNIDELQGLIKVLPPPIPQASERSLEIEGQISKKKEKLITPTAEIIFAKETKTIFKLILFALLIGLIPYPFFFEKKGGFDHLNMISKLKRHTDNFSQNLNSEKLQLYNEEEKILESESKQLGYPNYSKFGLGFSMEGAILYHQQRFSHAAKISFTPSLKIALFSAIILVIGRYFTKLAQWIDKTSKKQI